MARGRLKKVVEETEDGGQYFSADSSIAQKDIEFFSSGSTLIDCVLGGGWAEGRLANIVGDSGTAKTGLAVMACASFHKKYPSGKIWYVETEQAFDIDHAEKLGFPTNDVEFVENCDTVEAVGDHMEACLEAQGKDKSPGLYIVDSLDALSDKSELDRTMTDSSFGANKAKKLSELFRRLNAKMSMSNITIIIVSQVRDNIGVAFGEKHSRSGGKALRFYASQELWLANLGKIDKTYSGIKRVIGVKIRAKTKKNKVGMPFREVDFDYIFGVGINEIKSSIDWLESAKSLEVTGLDGPSATSLIKNLNSLSDEEYFEWYDKITASVKEVWQSIEENFEAPRRIR